MADSCTVCDRSLPTVPLEQRQRGGRPRRFCPAPARCKALGDRRARMLARMTRWRDRALARGQEALAAELTTRIEGLRNAPYAVTRVAPISQTALQQMYREQQQRILNRSHRQES
jgi:hypothetical protein